MFDTFVLVNFIQLWHRARLRQQQNTAPLDLAARNRNIQSSSGHDNTHLNCVIDRSLFDGFHTCTHSRTNPLANEIDIATQFLPKRQLVRCIQHAHGSSRVPTVQMCDRVQEQSHQRTCTDTSACTLHMARLTWPDPTHQCTDGNANTASNADAGSRASATTHAPRTGIGRQNTNAHYTSLPLPPPSHLHPHPRTCPRAKNTKPEMCCVQGGWVPHHMYTHTSKHARTHTHH